ncbi:MAG TPA: Hpt domain-containing protein [Rhizomicrobium sp.]|jgi:HPt (histidine-containing phosphotransfer) domain-containing protein
MTKSKQAPQAEIIGTDQYPAMLDPEAAEAFLVELSLRDTSKRANNALETKRVQISHAVRGYVEALEKAVEGNDIKTMIEQAHEIRGLAANAGLEAVGRLADGLYKYIDTATRLEAPVDADVILLHINAIARAATAASEAKAYGEKVAVELNALVTHKLQAINRLKTKSA